MKISYPLLDLLVFIIRLVGLLEIIFAVAGLFDNSYGSFSMFTSIGLFVGSFFTFAFAELLKLAIDISEHTKQTAKHLESISELIEKRIN